MGSVGAELSARFAILTGLTQVEVFDVAVNDVKT